MAHTEQARIRAGSDPVDGLMEVYVDWREESAALDDAYRRWSSAPETDRALAFAAYRAALDREEQASIVYRNELSRVSHLIVDSELALRLSVDNEAMH